MNSSGDVEIGTSHYQISRCNFREMEEDETAEGDRQSRLQLGNLMVNPLFYDAKEKLRST